MPVISSQSRLQKATLLATSEKLPRRKRAILSNMSTQIPLFSGKFPLPSTETSLRTSILISSMTIHCCWWICCQISSQTPMLQGNSISSCKLCLLASWILSQLVFISNSLTLLPLRPVAPCSNLQTPTPTTDDLGALHVTFLHCFPKESPLALGMPSAIQSLQTSTSQKGFCCNRPPSAVATIPITLLHPIFNEFKADCEAHQLTREDNTLALELSSAMSSFFPDEKARQKEFIKVLERHGLFIIPAEIMGMKYQTDGDMHYKWFPYFICELKHEMGSKGAEPIFQSAVYYTSHLRQQERLSPHSPFPCLTLYLISKGPYILLESIY